MYITFPAMRKSSAFPSKTESSGVARESLTAAFNWYPTYHSRVDFNVIRAKLKSADPVCVFQARLQVFF